MINCALRKYFHTTITTTTTRRRRRSINLIRNMSIYTNHQQIDNNVELCNGKVITCCEPEDYVLFLKHRPRGPYTTMRTLQNRTHIFQFHNHVQRLIDSTKVMLNEEKEQGSHEFDAMHGRDATKCEHQMSQLFDNHTMCSLLRQVAKNSIVAYTERYHPEVDQELKLTILIVWDKQHVAFDIYSHVVNLSERPDRPVLADIRPGSRTGMKAKDSIWIDMRDAILAKKTKQSNEVLMCEEDGSVREGLSSNFFIVKDGFSICTANEGILDGTVKQLVDQIAIDPNNNVTYNNDKLHLGYCIPNLRDLSTWKEAFITSTSRQILPIYGFVIAGECVQFVDSKARSQLQQADSSSDFYYPLLPSDQRTISPYAQALQNELTKRLLPMSTRVLDDSDDE
jgi:hypothetical protein